MESSKYRGHEIHEVDGRWFYVDNGVSVSSNKNRECGHCNNKQTDEGHDACLGTLPGVMNACCGHGSLSDTYVQFYDGYTVHGETAKTIIDILKE